MISLGASAASRWLKCTASPGFIDREEARIPKESSRYADEGTEAHAWAAKALEAWKQGDAFDFDTIPDEDSRPYVRSYAEFVFAQVGTGPSSQLRIEDKVPLFYMPTRNGVVDACVLGEVISVIDLKYGAGVSVDAVENPQMAIYARSQIEAAVRTGSPSPPPSTRLELSIFQPRCREGEAVRTWALSFAELMEFTDEIAKVASSILENPAGGVFFPDDEGPCRFCAAKAICTPRARHLLGELPDETLPAETRVALRPETAAPEFPAPEALTLEQVGRIMKVRSGLKKWLDEVSDYGTAMVMVKGEKVPGWKVVAGRAGHRKWADPKEAARLLKNVLASEEIYTREVISPAQAEKILKGKEVSTRLSNSLKAVMTKSEGAPTLVPESDPRDDLVVSATSEFENLEIENLL